MCVFVTPRTGAPLGCWQPFSGSLIYKSPELPIFWRKHLERGRVVQYYALVHYYRTKKLRRDRCTILLLADTTRNTDAVKRVWKCGVHALYLSAEFSDSVNLSLQIGMFDMPRGGRVFVRRVCECKYM